MKRIVQSEFLDVLPFDDPRAVRSRQDLRRLNEWMRNHVIMGEALQNAFARHAPGQIIEIGAGDGTFLLRVAQKIGSRWRGVSATLIDRQGIVSLKTLSNYAALGWEAEAIVADVFDRPQFDGEIVVANLFLHHFDDTQLAKLLRMVSRRARQFIAVEPRRACWPLFCGRLVWAIGCNYVTRHDAVASVRAGFSCNELSSLWPDKQGWRLTEQSAGPLSHLFIARKIS